MPIHRFDEVSSTQQTARRLWESGQAQLGDIIIAARQTQGRGRFGRQWASPTGNLYATFLQPPAPLISLAAGVAVARILRHEGIPAQLKWPNDILVEERKIAGVLVEQGTQYALVGVGLNLVCAPVEGATCVAHYQANVDRDAWIARLAASLQEAVATDSLIEEYRQLSHTLGHVVRVQRGPNQPPLVGLAADIDAHGQLLVRTETTVEAVASGDCARLTALSG